jgi:hypothetical protein
MNISKEGLDSRVLRWSGFAMAAFIAAALAGGFASEGPTARKQVSDATVWIGQVTPPAVCGDRC